MPDTETKPDVGTVDLLDVLTEGRTLPEGFDRWGIKSVHPDLKTHGGYQWPYPGSVAAAENPNPSNP